MFRKDRVTDMLQDFLSKNLSSMRDPRIGNVSINEIDLSSDLRHTKIYWSFILDQKTDKKNNKEADKKETQKALDGSVGFLRKKIAEQLDLKYVPELNFKYDIALETGARMDQILDALITKTPVTKASPSETTEDADVESVMDKTDAN